MTPTALRAAKMLEANGNWTSKYGIHSAAQFLASPEAQEEALTDLLNGTERQLRANGAFDYVGTTIDGRVARFVVTHAGLVAAAHRDGAAATSRYLSKLERAGFLSSHANLTRENLRVETRLRTFSGQSYD